MGSRARPDGDELPRRSHALVGRVAELATVIDVLVGGVPGSVIVVGEAGIGKSRLVSVALESVHGVRAAVGNCLPLSQSPPLLPVAEALRQLLGPGSDSARWLADAPEWVGTEIGRIVPALGGRAGPTLLDAGSHRYRMFEAIKHVLAMAAADGPTVLVVEDLHWADEVTLDALLFLLGSAEACPVPVLLTVRDDMPAPVESVVTRLQLAGAVRRIALTELTQEETGAQMRETLGAAQSPGAVLDVYRRSGGNPLFIDQLVSHLASGGVGAAGLVPPGLESLLATRVDAVGPIGLTVLRCLALADRPLDTEAIAVASNIPLDRVIDEVDELQRSRLLRVAVDGAGIETRHSLIAEVVRATPMPSEERRRLHSGIAEVLIRQDAADAAAEVADHLAAAGRSQDQLPWRIRAGDHAHTVHAPKVAADHYARAITVWHDGGFQPMFAVGIEPWQLYERAFLAADEAGDPAHALALADEAYRRFATGASPSLLAWLEVNRGHFQRRADDGGPVLSLETALWIAETNELDEMTVRVHQELAGLYLSRGDFVLAREHVAAALQAGRTTGRPDVVCRLEAIDLWLVTALGQRSAPAALAEASCQSEAHGASPAAAVETYGRLGDLLLDLGELSAAVELQSRALTLADAHGLASGYWTDAARYNLVEALLEGGKTDRADEIVAAAYREGEFPITTATGLVRAAVDLRLGRQDLARRLWDEARVPTAPTAMRREYCLQRLDFAVWTGDLEPALEEALAVLESTSTTDQSQFVGALLALGMRAVVTLLLTAREPERVRRGEQYRERLMTVRSSSRVDPFGRRVIPVAAFAHGATWEAELTRWDGRSEAGDAADAADAWRTAADAWRGLGRPHRVGYALLREGEALAAAGGQRRRLVEAVEMAAAASVGHRPLADAVGELARMARIAVPGDAGPPQRTPVTMLTSREHAVLALVVQGRTNAEIGAVLHISPKTAGVHVSNILHKLGVQSRVQAAAIAARLGLDGAGPRVR